MVKVSVPTRWPFCKTANEPESISFPSCFVSLSFSPGRGEDDAVIHIAIPMFTTKTASSRLDNLNFNFNLTVILLFRSELRGPELRRRTPHHPELAKYSRF